MRRHAGFTMVELLVTVAILGIMTATAFPLYNKWVQRTYGSEAALTLKRILDGEIAYILENDDFFPEVGNPVHIYHDGKDPSAADVQRTKDALNITLPVGHFLDFTITHGIEEDGTKFCLVDIRADFPLFKADETHPDPTYICAKMDEKGTITHPY